MGVFNNIVVYLFDVKQFKNGRVSVVFKRDMETLKKICEEMNLYHYKLSDGHKIYFIKKENVFEEIRRNDINHLILEYLKMVLFSVEDYPEGLCIKDFIEAYYKFRLNVSQRLMTILCPYLDLPENEKHDFLMKFDHGFKSLHIKNELLHAFEAWGMKEAIDDIGFFQKGCRLFYKRIQGKKFLMFSFFANDTKNHNYQFDPWIAYYKAEKDIGRKLPIEVENDFGYPNFQLERDYHFVREYVESKE